MSVEDFDFKIFFFRNSWVMVIPKRVIAGKGKWMETAPSQKEYVVK
jgi:hypothetical protein